MSNTSNRTALDRRSFLQGSALIGAGLAAGGLAAAEKSAEKLAVGVVGLGRGMGHVAALLQIPAVEILVANADLANAGQCPGGKGG